MSLATLTGGQSNEHEPFQFWDTEDANNSVDHLPDVPRDVSAQPEPQPSEQPPVDSSLAAEDTAPTPTASNTPRPSEAPQAAHAADRMPHAQPGAPSPPNADAFDEQRESSAGPVRHHRGEFSGSSVEPPSDATTDASDLLSKSAGDDSSSTSVNSGPSGDYYPAVPKADYVVKGGVRLTSTGKPSRT
jgi:hypothetical protein